MAFEIENVEVAARHVDCDVVHGHLADRPLETAAVRMSMQDDVRTIFRDRRGEAIAAEKSGEPIQYISP